MKGSPEFTRSSKELITDREQGQVEICWTTLYDFVKSKPLEGLITGRDALNPPGKE